jgi:hypothetical protein
VNGLLKLMLVNLQYYLSAAGNFYRPEFQDHKQESGGVNASPHVQVCALQLSCVEHELGRMPIALRLPRRLSPSTHATSWQTRSTVFTPKQKPSRRFQQMVSTKRWDCCISDFCLQCRWHVQEGGFPGNEHHASIPR